MVGSPYYNIKFIGAIDCKSLSSLLPLPPQHTDMWKLLCSAHISSCVILRIRDNNLISQRHNEAVMHVHVLES